MLNRFRQFTIFHAKCGFREPIVRAIILSNRLLRDSKFIGPRCALASPLLRSSAKLCEYSCPKCGEQMQEQDFIDWKLSDIPDGCIFPMHEELISC